MTPAVPVRFVLRVDEAGALAWLGSGFVTDRAGHSLQNEDDDRSEDEAGGSTTPPASLWVHTRVQLVIGASVRAVSEKNAI